MKKMLSEPAIIKDWVAALRSGKYKQGRGALHTLENTYCCLGVLVDVLVKDYGVSHTVAEDNTCIRQSWIDRHLPLINNMSYAYPDMSASTLFTKQHVLMNLNDDKRYTFWQIADFIEDHYKKEKA